MWRVIRLTAATVILGAGFGVAGGLLSSRTPALASTVTNHSFGLVYTHRFIGPPERPVPLPARPAAERPAVARPGGAGPAASAKKVVPKVTKDPSSVTVASGGKASFAAAASGSPTPTVRWEISTNSGATFTAISGATAATYSFTATAARNGDRYEAVFTNSAGTARTKAATLKVTIAPEVTADPVSVTVTSGGTASFRAGASGRPTPTVKWEVSSNSGATFTPIAGADATTYSFTATTGENGDRYRAVFTNPAGTATTTAATLTVTAPTTAPAVTTDPSSATVAAGTTASFEAAAAGSPAPTVVWEVSSNSGATFTPIAGADATTYSFTATTGENGDRYRAVFTNPAGTATTTAATLTVTAPTTAPAVTTDPSSATVAAGTTASFEAAAAGSPTPTVVWEVSSNSGATFTPVAGADATTYSFTATTGENGDRYEAVFTNPAGTATTTAATLTVTAPTTAPAVTTDPSSATVAAGTTASFEAAAAGSPTPTVVWEVSSNSGATFTPVAGADATTYSFTATTGENGDRYEAVFTNPAGTATTTAATLTVTTAPSLGASTNWSGYAATGTSFDAVTGRWTVPAVTCTGSRSAYSAQWIGIDGDTSSTVEQDGTEADCLSGTPSYDAWYELYGDTAENGGAEIELGTAGYPVVPGDEMTASVSETDNVWTFALADASTAHQNWTYTSAGITFAASQSSAEWIIERPELCGRSCSLTSLADFGTTAMGDATATTSQLTGAPIDSFASVDIEMVNTAGTYVLAQPGALGSGGDSFTDTWEAAD